MEYVRNLYEIMDRLRAKHPKLEIESCSGGGGRIDLGILQRVDEVWTSDNTDAFDRLRIQEGFSMAYAPKYHVGVGHRRAQHERPEHPARASAFWPPCRARSASAPTSISSATGGFRAGRPDDGAVQANPRHGADRRPVPAGSARARNDVTVNEYVAADGKQSVVFAFRHSQQYNTAAPTIRLRGLDEKATYRVESEDGKLLDSGREFSGAWLMGVGLNLNLHGDYDSAAVVLDKL